VLRDILFTRIEIFKDGRITMSELSSLLADKIAGEALGTIPFLGGIMATIYDVFGGDDYVRDYIKSLVIKYYGQSGGVIYE
jgi:hypothetical protein